MWMLPWRRHQGFAEQATPVMSTSSPLDGAVSLMASLLYGAGLQLLECAELPRIKDVDLAARELRVGDG